MVLNTNVAVVAVVVYSFRMKKERNKDGTHTGSVSERKEGKDTPDD